MLTKSGWYDCLLKAQTGGLFKVGQLIGCGQDLDSEPGASVADANGEAGRRYQGF